MKLTIITINYNNAEGLRKTLASTATQTNKDFEHIIVDGGSFDGSVEVIKEYAASFSAKGTSSFGKAEHSIIWVSEKDHGIYNAMNKGIRMAHGEYLLFLNSGDALADEKVILNFHNSTITTDIATGIERMPNGKLVYPKEESELTYSYFYDDTLLHQSTFIRKEAFNRHGLYNETNRIVSDWEWFFRVLIREDATYQTLNFVVSDFDGTGMSNSKKWLQIHNEEREKVRQTILPRVRPDYNELMRLREVEREYQFLKNGRMGWVVRLLLKCKKIMK